MSLPKMSPNYFIIQTRCVTEESSIAESIDADINVFRESWENWIYYSHLEYAISKGREYNMICTESKSAFRILEVKNKVIDTPSEYVERQHTYYEGHKNWIYKFVLISRIDDNLEEKEYDLYSDAFKAWESISTEKTLLDKRCKVVHMEEYTPTMDDES